jgi:ribonuclease P protein component
MFDAENESMDSAPAAEPERVAQSSSVAAPRAASGSPPESLKGRARFSEVYATGTRYRSGGITVLIARDGRAPHVGIVAGKRQIGSAVVRNRAKRRLRAALDQVALPDGSYIVFASRAVLTAPFGELVRWLEAATKEKRV